MATYSFYGSFVHGMTYSKSVVGCHVPRAQLDGTARPPSSLDVPRMTVPAISDHTKREKRDRCNSCDKGR